MKLRISLLLIFLSLKSVSRSLELMPGTERVFVDVQWLKFLDEKSSWSVFSRSRATSDYEGNSNLFTGAYLNYTTKMGLGTTLVGRMSSNNVGGDIGIHFFKANQHFMVYALTSVEMSSNFSYSWFSIARYTPALNENWDIYSSLELFTNFSQSRHVASVQRIRAGLSSNGWQFGLAFNLSGLGENYQVRDFNPGVFVRKQF